MTAAIASDPYISGISSGSSFMTDVKEHSCSQGNTGKKKKNQSPLYSGLLTTLTTQKVISMQL